MNYIHMTPRYDSIREEVERHTGRDGFNRVLEKALKLYRKFKASSEGLRKSKEYGENDGVLRNESFGVRHVAAIILYTDWSELCCGEYVYIICK